jgi:hypothetical protein
MEGELDRTGVMAPPNLRELPPRAGLMAPEPGAVAHEISLRAALWCMALVLGAVEVLFEGLGP